MTGPSAVGLLLKWPIDKQTRLTASAFPIRIYSAMPIPQVEGQNFKSQAWVSRLLQGDHFPHACLHSDPAVILGEFEAGHYLQALALTISWGNMTRTTTRRIYHKCTATEILAALYNCADSIAETNSIHVSWELLTGTLDWTSVITSKVLHFLCRALGYTDNPPVPIDGAVIRAYVWPGFRIGIPPEQRPQDWQEDGFEAYCRYMTAIGVWAEARGWTTTEIETTLYSENR